MFDNPRRYLPAVAAERVFGIASGAFLWLAWLNFPGPVAEELHLDQSWSLALAHFFKTGGQLGSDYVFTYGPLGYFVTGVFDADLFWFRYAWELLFAALAVAILLQFMARLRVTVFRVSFVLFTGVAVASSEARFFVLIVAVGLLQLVDDDWSWTRVAWTTGVLALLANIKFTFFLFAVATALVVPLGRSGGRNKGIDLTRSVGLFAGFFAFIWMLAGQSPLNVPRYLKTSYEIAHGYSEAMTILGPNEWLTIAQALQVSFLATAFVHRFSALRSFRRWVGLLIIALGLFAAWKAGFVRHDREHSLTYFGYATLCPLFILILDPAGVRPPILRAPFVVLSIVGATGAYLHVHSDHEESANENPSGEPPPGVLERLVTGIVYDAECFTAPVACKQRLQDQTDEGVAKWQLPRIRDHVRKRSIDVVTVDQTVILKNDLTWKPRPVFQSYTAYTSALTELNGRFLASPGAPEFIAARWITIDDRFLPHDDGRTLFTMLRRYQPLFVEGEFLLLERRPPAEVARHPGRILREVSARFGQRISLHRLPKGLITASFNFHYTLRGRLRRLLFRSPPVFIGARLGRHESKRTRIIPDLANSEFLINPLIEWNYDLLRVYAQRPNRQIWWFRISTDENGKRVYEDLFEVTLRWYPFPTVPKSIEKLKP